MANLLLMVIPSPSPRPRFHEPDGVLIKEIERILDVSQVFFLLFDRKE
jgi:hypothetical protein